jgi:IS4 transposase
MRNTSEGYLWDVLDKTELAGTHTVQVPRSGNRPARQAQLTVRFSKVTLKPPGKKSHLPEVQAWAVYAREENADADIENPLEWLIVTTVATANFEQAKTILEWYTQRWGIEVYHRTLKSGCKIEHRQLRNTERIKSCLAIDLIIAWRIFYLTKLSRKTPDAPSDFFLKSANGKL